MLTFCPAKGKLQQAWVKQQGRGGQSTPSISPLLDQLGQDPLSCCVTAPCTLLLAWQVFTFRLQVSYIWFFSFFLVPNCLELHRDVLARKVFRGRSVILQMPYKTTHRCRRNFSWQYIHMVQSRDLVIFWGKNAIISKGRAKSM